MARHGAAWGGYGAAWAAWAAPSRCPRTVRTSNRAFRVFTKQETRLFSPWVRKGHTIRTPPGPPRTPPGRRFPARCGAAWGGYGAAWAAAVPRTGTRPVSLSRITRHETWPFPHFPRIPHEFPRFPTISRPPPTPRCPRAGLDLGRPRSKRRSLPLLPPSGLLPPPRTQQEPMFRKQNVLDCVDSMIGRAE